VEVLRERWGCSVVGGSGEVKGFGMDMRRSRDFFEIVSVTPLSTGVRRWSFNLRRRIVLSHCGLGERLFVYRKMPLRVRCLRRGFGRLLVATCRSLLWFSNLGCPLHLIDGRRSSSGFVVVAVGCGLLVRRAFFFF